MIGPSSSHTAGAVNIGRVAGQVFGGDISTIELTLYGSFAATYRGHGTDRALVAGVMGMTPHNPLVKDALRMAEERKIKVKIILEGESPYHPNTVKMVLSNGDAKSKIVGTSLGGGRIAVREIDSFKVNITGSYNVLLCSYKEQVGMVAGVSRVLAANKINIAFMTVSRNVERSEALMILETDEGLDQKTLGDIKSIDGMDVVRYIPQISDEGGHA